ncbi:hypothetical protein GF376_03865 [Candidatus Peregrinibacteria bacterium]|nr:hypothetical protein [Candidatus Peregrinibacteria bacterium]
MKKNYIKNTNNNFFFDADQFVHNVLIASKMMDADPQTIDELAIEIKGLLSTRIMETIVDSFGERELFLLNKLLEDHPQIDEIDALSLIVPMVDGLDELIIKTVDGLFDELIENAIAINMQLKE